MDENNTRIAVPVGEAGREVTMSSAHENRSKMRRRIRRAEKLLRQMAGLQQDITRELAEISNEVGHICRADAGIIDVDSSSDEEDDAPIAQEAPEVEVGTAPHSASAVISFQEDYNLAAATPKVALVSWGLMTTTIRDLTQYAAIEVSSNEPIGTFDPGTTWNRFSDPGSTTNRGGLLPDRIQINSPALKAELRQIFGDDETTLSAPAAKPLILLRPFKMLFYHEKSITARLDGAGKTNDQETANSINELRVLDSLMESTFRPCKESLETVADTAAFSDLWYIFSPGSPIYVQASDYVQKVWCVVQRTGGRRYLKRPGHIPASAFKYQTSPFVIDCYFVDFDGRRHVPVYGRFEILPYHGVRALASLSVFPLRIALKTGVANREDLISRGKEFLSYTKGIAHRSYDGFSLTRMPDGRKPFPEYEEKFDGEVIIDFGQTLERKPEWRLPVKEPELYEMDRSELGDPSHNIDQDWVYDKRLSDRVIIQLKEGLLSLQDEQVKPDEQLLLLLPDRVLGFVLRNRKFASLQIGVSPDGLRPLMHVVHEEEPWSKLYLPTGHRQMIQSLVEQHIKDDIEWTVDHPQVDLIRGKGKGLIILLHGAPGTGKTLTAECAASSTKRPLFPMTCGDLGTAAAEVEANLEQNFHLAKTWGCVLLLDEADTFLSARTKEDFVRNSLVSVFLRVLEYYAGILFLTTNRIGDFDEAFASRIHMSLYYPQLDVEGTLTIWKNNIQRLKERAKMPLSDLLVDETELLHYAKELYGRQQKDHSTWNGREIRNTFQSALALAEFGLKPGSAARLTPDHFESIYQSFKQFKSYLQPLHLHRADMTMMRLDRGKPPAKLPNVGVDGTSGDTGRLGGRSNSSSGSSEASESTRYPRFPPWQSLYNQPQRFGLQEAVSANEHEQQMSDLVPRGQFPAPPAMYYHPTGPYGMPTYPQYQAMEQPSGMYPNTLSGPPGFSPPITMEPANGPRGLRPDSVHGPQSVSNPPQASAPANDPFDWLGERTQTLPNTPGGRDSRGLNAGDRSAGGRERKRKRRGPNF